MIMKKLIFKTFKDLAIYWGIVSKNPTPKSIKCNMSKHEIDREMRNNKHSKGWYN